MISKSTRKKVMTTDCGVTITTVIDLPIGGTIQSVIDMPENVVITFCNENLQNTFCNF